VERLSGGRVDARLGEEGARTADGGRQRVKRLPGGDAREREQGQGLGLVGDGGRLWV